MSQFHRFSMSCPPTAWWKEPWYFLTSSYKARRATRWLRLADKARCMIVKDDHGTILVWVRGTLLDEPDLHFAIAEMPPGAIDEELHNAGPNPGSVPVPKRGKSGSWTRVVPVQGTWRHVLQSFAMDPFEYVPISRMWDYRTRRDAARLDAGRASLWRNDRGVLQIRCRHRRRRARAWESILNQSVPDRRVDPTSKEVYQPDPRCLNEVQPRKISWYQAFTEWAPIRDDGALRRQVLQWRILLPLFLAAHRGEVRILQDVRGCTFTQAAGQEPRRCYRMEDALWTPHARRGLVARVAIQEPVSEKAPPEEVHVEMRRQHRVPPTRSQPP